MNSDQLITSFTGDYFFLSNFYECPVTYEGITYGSAEAAFQAQKCRDKSCKVQFMNLNPFDAKHLGRRVAIRPDWEDVKIGIMQKIVYQKFYQNKDLIPKLLDTKTAILIEGNDWGDRTWGAVPTPDGHWDGYNALGAILMGVRTHYQFIRESKKY